MTERVSLAASKTALARVWPVILLPWLGCLGWFLAPAPAWAGVQEDLRACERDVYPNLPRGGQPSVTTPQDQYCVGLGYWFQRGGLRRDYTAAARWYAQAAAQGHPGAQAALGRGYEKGDGVPKSIPDALQWYRAAAAGGNADAMFALAYFYQQGVGVGKNEAEAMKWARMAAEHGSERARVYLREQQEAGQRKGTLELAARAYKAYKTGDHGQAVALYRQAAEAGDAGAQVALGTMLRLGQGVPRSAAEGVAWYRKAAAQGNARAQAQLGFSLEYGDGVPANWTAAYQWCARSAAQLDRLGLYCQGRQYQFGIGVAQDRAKAIPLFDKAANQGDKQSAFFARWLSKSEHCAGYRDEPERTRYLGVCADPEGMAFESPRERAAWLNAKLGELKIAPIDGGFGSGACGAAGGTSGGGGCRGDGGQTFDPMQQDRYGRPLW